METNLFIGGKYVAPSGGARFVDIEPATERELAQVADAGPEDIERAVATVPGVRQGNVIAFGVEGRKGREGVVVVAETREAEHHPIRKGVAAAVRQSVGLAIEDLVLVEAGSLPKTSSGKLQRSLCRRRYLEAELEPA